MRGPVIGHSQPSDRPRRIWTTQRFLLHCPFVSFQLGCLISMVMKSFCNHNRGHDIDVLDWVGGTCVWWMQIPPLLWYNRARPSLVFFFELSKFRASKADLLSGTKIQEQNLTVFVWIRMNRGLRWVSGLTFMQPLCDKKKVWNA